MNPIETELSSYKTEIEKIMLSLDPSQTQEMHRQYLGGYIDCLHDSGLISEETRENLYVEYCS